jgi:outer membrane biosynthesis protein TonB
VLLHAVIASGALFFAAKQPRTSATVARQTLELEFAAPPRVQTPSRPTQIEPQPPQPQLQRPQPVNANARVVRSSSNTTPQNVEPNTQTTQQIEPQNNNSANTAQVDPFPWRHTNAQNATATTRVLSAVELMNPSATDMMAAAHNAGVALPSAAEVRIANRQLINTGHCNGTPEECARAAASAPIIAAANAFGRPNPPGTAAHARSVVATARTTFLPVRQIPDVGALVLRAPLFTPPSTVREVPAGEQAAGRDLDYAHAQSGAMSTGGTVQIPSPPYHLVRAEIEVDQAPTGAIIEVRVAQSSRNHTFDRAAEQAIREALTESEPFNTNAPRRSRWAFEVSDAVRGERLDLLVRGGGNEGWTVIPEESNGVRLRYRVRHVQTRLLTVPAPTGTGPVQPAHTG